LERIDLFKIPYGVSESAVNPVSLHIDTIDITMSQGIFSLLDGAGGKLITFSSFGDMLSSKKVIITSTGSVIAVDPSQNMFIADNHSNLVQRIFDQQSYTYADSIIRRFSRFGDEFQYLGQEGPGGTPFPRILSLQVHSDSTLAVVSMSETVWLIHHFGKAGNLLSSIRFSEDALPIPGLLTDVSDAQDWRVHVNLDKIHTSSKDGILNIYLKFDYYRESSTAERGTISGVEYFGSWIFVVDSRSGRIFRSIEIQGSKDSDQIPEFIGIWDNTLIFVTKRYGSPAEEINRAMAQINLTLLDADGGVLFKALLDLPTDTLELPVLKASDDGQIFALAKRNTDAVVFWWNLGNHIRRKL
jgi:hypothetical protein